MKKQCPCKGCPERFIACSNKCPVDARGEYGYNTWLQDVRKLQAAEREYKRQRREDFKHSEECKNGQIAYSNSKTRRRRGDRHGR